MNNQTIVSFSYTKQRNMFGMIGIEINPAKKLAYVRLAKQWKRDDMNLIPDDVKQIYSKVKWNLTFADQLIGQHLIRSLEQSLGFGVQTITTQKNLKDPENIELLKVMDITEMTQLTLSLKQAHQLQFPPNNQSVDMLQLIKQLEMFTEFVTENGTISYHAPGDELDCLPRALMICCFVGRTILQHGFLEPIIRRGVPTAQTAAKSFDDYFKHAMGDDMGELSVNHLNTMDRRKLYAPKRFGF